MKQCAIDGFREVIENQKENLKYIEQLKLTIQAFEEGETQKLKQLLTGILGDVFEKQIAKLFEGKLNFNTIMGALQMIAIINPAVFGSCLVRETSKLEQFFRNEYAKLQLVIDDVLELLDHLDSDWSGLLNYNELITEHRKELNKLYNENLPEALIHFSYAKNELISAQNRLIYGNVIRDPETGERFSENIDGAKRHLGMVVELFLPPSEPSLIEQLIGLSALWARLWANVANLIDLDSPDWQKVKQEFREVGQNFGKFLESLHAANSIILDVVSQIEDLEHDLDNTWVLVHEPLIASNNALRPAIELSARVGQAIYNYLETGQPQPLGLPLPSIGNPVTDASITQWEKQANIYRSFQISWRDLTLDAIEKLNGIRRSGAADALEKYETIYSPIFDAVIMLYESVSAPLWKALYNSVTILGNIVELMKRGQPVVEDLYVRVIALRDAAQSLQGALGAAINYFESNNITQGLKSALGVSLSVEAALGGLASLADSLGLDFLSGLIENGDMLTALGLDERSANSIQRLLGCLQDLGDVTTEVREVAMKIRRLVSNEKLRQDKLRHNMLAAVEEGIKSQRAAILEREEMLRKIEEEA